MVVTKDISCVPALSSGAPLREACWPHGVHLDLPSRNQHAQGPMESHFLGWALSQACPMVPSASSASRNVEGKSPGVPHT